jgi:hypothetical protein
MGAVLTSQGVYALAVAKCHGGCEQRGARFGWTRHAQLGFEIDVLRHLVR